MLTIHHLGRSQSERILWLCEELAIPYQLKRYERDASMQAPSEYKKLHPLGAIIEYIIAVHGDGRLAVGKGQPNFADYLYWFHFVNGTLHPSLGRNLIFTRCGLTDENPMVRIMMNRTDQSMDIVEARLGKVPYLAGDEFSAADIMMVFTLTTMRYFLPFDLTPYHNILGYLQRMAKRPAYSVAMAKGDPGMPLLLT